MAISLNAELKCDDIKSITKLDKIRPIFLIVGEPGHIVVKREMTGQANDPSNMRYALRNMTTVDRTIQSKQLTQQELGALQQYIEIAKLDATFGNSAVPEVVSQLDEALSHVGPTWLKMNKLEGIMNLEGAASQARMEGAQRNKTGVRAIAAALGAPGGLEKLGAILAIDLFNGNNDRFDISDMPQAEAKIPTRDFAPDENPTFHQGVHFKRMTNIGNVVFCIQDNILKPVGLDAYAGSSEFRDFSAAVDPPQNWPGRNLRTDRRHWRQKFSEDVAADIETALGPRNRKLKLFGTTLFGSGNRLPANAATRIATGMDEGANRLKAKLLNVDQPQRLPPGLLSRFIAVGWAVRRADGSVQPAPPH